MSRVRRSWRPRRGAVCALLALLALCALVAAGGEAQGKPRRSPLKREAQALAERLYAQLEAARTAARDRAVLECAFELVDRYRGFPDNDRVLLFAARSALRLGDRPLARQLLAELRAGWTDSPLLPEAQAMASGLEAGSTAGEGGRPAAAPDATAAAPAVVAATPAASAPPPAPASAAARSPGGLPAEFAPIAAAAPPPGVRAVAGGPVDPGLIGLLCPVTGPDAQAGAAFAAGGELAASHAARGGWRRVRLRVADTAGDPVEAARQARALAAGEGAVALVGAVGAPTTAAAAAVADAWALPLVAPAGAAPRLRDYGPAVVPTDLVEAHDARVLARLSVAVLGRPRAAVIYPDTPEGARACAAFVAALAEAGGRLVATAACAADGDGVEAAARVVAEARPEVLFAPLAPAAAARALAASPATPTRARLLGPSAWDDAPPAAFADSVLAGALFPAAAAVWPEEWVRDFAREWPDVAPAEGGTAAARLALRAYAGVRLVAEAMSDCGLTPDRESLAGALRARWGRLRDAAVPAVDAIRVTRVVRGGATVPYAPEADTATVGR